MKVSDFCKFFNFTIGLIPTDTVSEDILSDYGLENTSDRWIYEAVDDQGVFSSRYADKVEDFADLFDSMLLDYVDSIMFDAGFEWDQYSDEPEYKQALRWIVDSELKDSVIYDVVKVLDDPTQLEDDVEAVDY